MSLWEILLTAVALAMDALAVSVASGLAEPQVRAAKRHSMAGSFGIFQGFMPLIGFFIGSLFAEKVKKAAPWIAFILLALIGGKMLIESIRESRAEGAGEPAPRKGSPFGWMNILTMAFATSIDALAVGVTFATQSVGAGSAMTVGNMLGGQGYLVCCLIIAVVTYLISFAGVCVGARAGNIFGSRTGIVGGAVLILIGLKILIQSLLS